MSQSEWDRRVLLVLDREEELEPKDALGKEESDYFKTLMNLSDQGLLSRSKVMEEIYGTTARQSVGLSSLAKYATEDAATMKAFYEGVAERVAEEVETSKLRSPMETLSVKYEVDYEKMERWILGLDEEDDE